MNSKGNNINKTEYNNDSLSYTKTCNKCGYLVRVYDIDKQYGPPSYCIIFHAPLLCISQENICLRPSSCNIKKDIFTVYRDENTFDRVLNNVILNKGNV